MVLDDWARTYGVSYEAVKDLRRRLGVLTYAEHEPDGDKSEAAVQQQTRLVASQLGARLFRNNTGVATDHTGRPVRFGLCNDSSQLNKKIKSGDLIGVTPVVIQPYHVGRMFGLFTSYECKPERWVFRGTTRECAQDKFNRLIVSLGGIARFITDAGQLKQ